MRVQVNLVQCNSYVQRVQPCNLVAGTITGRRLVGWARARWLHNTMLVAQYNDICKREAKTFSPSQCVGIQNTAATKIINMNG